MKDLFIRSALFFFALYSVCTLFYPPPPLRSSPCLRGTVCWRDVYVATHFVHLRQGDKVNGGPKATGAKGQRPKGVTSMAKVDVLMCT